MALTKAQISKIQELIRRRFLAFTYEAVGERALTRSEIRELKRLGLIRDSVRNMVADPYILGKVVSTVERGRVRDVSLERILKLFGSTDKLGPVEKQAIKYAQDHAGQYIRGIGDALVKEVGATAARIAAQNLRAVRKEVVGALRDRSTVSELSTALRDATDDTFRDWRRVASTEINDAIQNGIYNELHDKSDEGRNQLVYKRPAPDGCRYCKAVYLKEDGFTPKIFRLRDLAPSNIGRKAKDWLPTVGSVHPWCQCQLHPVIEGFDFVKQRTVGTPFVSEGTSYKLGQVVDEEIYARLTVSQKNKLRWDAVLSYTGKTPKASVRKSLDNSAISENDSECVCSY